MCGDSELSDEELIALFKKGDKSACESLLLRYKSKVLALARRFSLAGGDADDLAQEGMLGLYSAIITYSGASFSPYANTCVRNRILDAIKSRGTLNGETKFLPFIDEVNSDISDGCSPEDYIVGRETLGEFLSILKNSLSALEYSALKAYYVDGATMAEITSALNVTYKQADNAIARAKSKAKILAKKSEKGKM